MRPALQSVYPPRPPLFYCFNSKLYNNFIFSHHPCFYLPLHFFLSCSSSLSFASALLSSSTLCVLTAIPTFVSDSSLNSQLLISAAPFFLQPFRDVKEDIQPPVFLQHALHLCAAAFTPAPGLPFFLPPDSILRHASYFSFVKSFTFPHFSIPPLLLSYSLVIQDKVLTLRCQPVEVGTS